jgi:sulfur-oxidizing protein SoxY
MNLTRDTGGKTRRDVIVRAIHVVAGAGFVSLAASKSARATPAMLQEAIDKLVGSAKIQTGRVTLDIPPLVENGNTVPVSVVVESPMTEADHVTEIHLFNEKNPQPYLMSASIGPRAGKARLATRIKLNDSQRVVAIARMSDGSFWSDGADVIVTIAACVEQLE